MSVTTVEPLAAETQDMSVPAPVAAPPAAGAPAASPPAAAAAASAEPTIDAEQVKKAKEFLGNAKVSTTPLGRRVNFLKSKGLNTAEIHTAFKEIGQPKTIAEIENAANNVSTDAPPPAAPTPAAAAAASATGPLRPYQQQVAAAPPAPQAVPAAADWKNYYVGATLAAGALYGLKTVASHFVDVDVRWKDPNAPRGKGARGKGGRDRELPPIPESLAKVSEIEAKVAALEAGQKATAEALQGAKASEEKLAELTKASESMLKKGAESATTLAKLEGKARMQDRLLERVNNIESEKRQNDETTENLKIALETLTKKVEEAAKGAAGVEEAKPEAAAAAADGEKAPEGGAEADKKEAKEEASSPVGASLVEAAAAPVAAAAAAATEEKKE
eukprot:Rhum_TRINITY_DN12947_c0_g1::Rhum_TRINITY_DN12947_c0_g1_i1::g.55720::m.55720/K13343/PEX14; peroxin-14